MYHAKAVSELEASSFSLSWAVVYMMHPVTEEHDYLWTHLCQWCVCKTKNTLCTKQVSVLPWHSQWDTQIKA